VSLREGEAPAEPNSLSGRWISRLGRSLALPIAECPWLGGSLAPPRGTTELYFGAPNYRTTLVGLLTPRTSFYVEQK